MPFFLAMLPVSPSALGARMPDSVEGDSIEPALPLCVAELVIVDPFQKVKGHEFHLARSCLMLDEARATLLEIRYNPCWNGVLRYHDRLNPKHESLPAGILLVSLAKVGPGYTHQLVVGATPSDGLDFQFSL